MPTQNVNLSPQQSNYIKRNVRGGRFRNASEVVRAGLRLLERQENEDKLKLAALKRLARGAFDEVDRGLFEAVDPHSLDAFLAGVDARVRKSAAR